VTEPRAVLEPIVPEPGTFAAQTMARGEPGVPARFSWRGTTYVVVEVLDSQRELGRCYAGANETYVRRHVSKVRVASGEVMTLSAARGSSRGPHRWILRSILAPASDTSSA
jgi:hypothetical protein